MCNKGKTVCTAYVHASAMAHTRQDICMHTPSFIPKLFTSAGTSYFINYHRSDTAVGSKHAHKVIQCDKLSTLYALANMCCKFQHKHILHTYGHFFVITI